MMCFFRQALLFLAFAAGNDELSETDAIVVVCGGGISGLALALGLAHDGFQVQVVEKDVMKPTGSAFCLQPNVDVLKQRHCHAEWWQVTSLVGCPRRVIGTSAKTA